MFLAEEHIFKTSSFLLHHNSWSSHHFNVKLINCPKPPCLFRMRSGQLRLFQGMSSQPSLAPCCNADADQLRTLAAATVTLSILVHIHFLSPAYVIFSPSFLWRFPPQLWRLVTSFMVTGPGFGILFDTYFCEHIMSYDRYCNR